MNQNRAEREMGDLKGEEREESQRESESPLTGAVNMLPSSHTPGACRTPCALWSQKLAQTG